MLEKENLAEFTTLVRIIAKLRSPDGCPWDRQQTHSSLKANLIEECYEVAEAIEKADSQELAEELGDLLMQVVLHSQIASDRGEFNINQVIRGINQKLISRHPHIFGGTQVKDAEEVALNWEMLKQREKGRDSILSGLPKMMPAITYSQAIQRRAARVGFDWQDVEGVIEKVVEELNELRQAGDQSEKMQEFGDCLFALTNLARWLDIDAEEALRSANEKFSRRFNYMEEICRERGLILSDLTPEEQDGLWQEAKVKVP
jgi:tetrapyrrole methylase family protein/MazG family protein